MLFNSLSFLVFFPVVVILHFLLPERFRPFFLLVASCVFYMAFVPQYVLILFFLITLDFFLAPLVYSATGARRRIYLWISVCANLGTLGLFKYFNFFNTNIAALAHFLHWNYDPWLLSLALPLGLSFHVFQSLSYVIEVYKGRFEPERNYLLYALYVMFFPQLVAGPIERPSHLLPQLRRTHSFESSRVAQGLERMGWGFFKKLVIADNIAPIVNLLYAAPHLTGPQIILVSVLFAYQLYCDFSGYSDIAVGAARVLGYEIMENFDRPFASRSIAEFWRRWHISLSSWLRDYLYYPLALGGTRHSALRLYESLFCTFLLVGLWHGANWTFIVWGGLHGFYLVFGIVTQEWRHGFADALRLTKLPRLYHAWQVVATFSLVVFTLVFFRAPTLGQAATMIGELRVGLGRLFDLSYLRFDLLTVQNIGVGKDELLVILLAVLVVELVQHLQKKAGTLYVLEMVPKVGRVFCWDALVFVTLILGHFAALPFIYFQF